MSSKDTKDITASELLRWAANEEPDEYGLSNVHSKLLSSLGGKSFAYTTTREDRESIRALADKIDAEIEAARREVSEGRFFVTLDTLIEAHGYPNRRAGEVFGEWPERCFIQRPLDEAGEPVQFGDRDIDWDNVGGHRDGRIRWCASAVDSRNRLYAMTSHEEIVAVAKADANGRVKRRTPEVLGADGLPIVEGETVWLLDGTEGTVKSLNRDNATAYVEWRDGGWSPCVLCDRLTHTPPDTQGRIDGDSQKTADEYWGCIDVSCEDCPAKIDGKNPHTRFDTRNCAQAQMLDLLRRQRELDARKGGE